MLQNTFFIYRFLKLLLLLFYIYNIFSYSTIFHIPLPVSVSFNFISDFNVITGRTPRLLFKFLALPYPSKTSPSDRPSFILIKFRYKHSKSRLIRLRCYLERGIKPIPIVIISGSVVVIFE